MARRWARLLRPAAAEEIRHLECRTHDRVQKQSGGLGGGCSGSRCGSRSKGLEVAQTVLVATFKYLAAVERASKNAAVALFNIASSSIS